MSGAAKPEEYGPRPGYLVPNPAVERGVAVVLSTSPCGTYLAYGNGSNVIIRSIEVFQSVKPKLHRSLCHHTRNICLTS